MNDPAYAAPPLDADADGDAAPQSEAVPELTIPSSPVERGEESQPGEDFAAVETEAAPDAGLPPSRAPEFADAAISAADAAGSAPAAAAAADPAAAAQARARPLPRINIQAFCADQRTAEVLQAASKDRRLAKTHVTVQMGVSRRRRRFTRKRRPPT